MNHLLVYAYVEEYNVLKGTEFSFHHDYDIHYDPKVKVLYVKKGPGLPMNFWKQSVASLSCIVGDNGAGKTTALRFILENITEGLPPEKDRKKMLVFSKDDGTLEYFSNIEGIHINTELDINSIEAADRFESAKPHSIENISYSSYPQKTSIDNPLGYESSGSHVLSDGWIVAKDLQHGENFDERLLSKIPYNTAKSIQYNREMYRVSRFISCAYSLIQGIDVPLPEYFRFTIDDSADIFFQYSHLISEDQQNTYLRLKKKLESFTSKDDRLCFTLRYYFSVLLNVSREQTSHIDMWLSIIDEILNSVQGINQPSLDDVKTVIVENIEKSTRQTAAINERHTSLSRGYKIIENANRVVDALAANAEYIPSMPMMYSGFYCCKCNDKKTKAIFESIFPEDNNLIMLTGEYVKVSYGYNQYQDCVLSSGEIQVYKLFSRLYDTLVTLPHKFSSSFNGKTVLLSLDEAEVGFHPEWQRKFVNVLLNFLDRIPNGPKYQIILTTHSPIILSDIPKCCVNYLKREGQETHSVPRENQLESFGSNVYDLLSSPFFMHQFIGDYAAGVINEIVKDVVETVSPQMMVDDSLLSRIKMIGDDYIRNALTRKLERP